MTASNAMATGDTSVIMTCHNEAAYVGHAIKSVLHQTASDRIREIFVVDDGSSDASPDVITHIARSEPRVRYLRLDGVGVSAARNHALDLAEGAYTAFLDGDDLWTPEKLEMQLPILDANQSVGLVYADYDEFDDHQSDIVEHCYPRRFLAGHANLLSDYYVFDSPVLPSTMVVRKRVLDDVGWFDPTFRVCEDTDICLRIAEKYEFHHVPKALLKKRRHENSLSNRQERLWENQVRITQTFASRNPELGALVEKRLSLRAAKVAWGLIETGDRRRMFLFLWRSFRHNPLNSRIYVYFALGCLPERVVQQTHRAIKAMRHSFG